MMGKEAERRLGPFGGQYAALFGHPWSVTGAAVAVGALNVFLFAFDRPWTASDGVRNWGDWLFLSLGILSRSDLISPLLYSGSILNLGTVAGGFASALLAREFAIQIAPPGELVKGGVGGFLMGIGSVLAFGCNLGGFFSALSALSLSGAAMMVGLGVGAYLGLRYLLW
ncbi:MAG: YeeE/YedE family protein, partial [Candidatus Rokubacteria bacterium]|nr:YeeE/YedE family protein [Candidatus Rokubacteria bacterium]